ncbi:hypothetical protein CRUP_000136 [Coryphaenoides rupestris]|nr:hypothetical protein CRUP_000136 [Coryphaenoides rupestris]
MIPRDFPVGENIITLSAIDIDELGSVSYRILSGNELDYFTLDPDTGALSLRRSLATAPSLKSGIFNLKVAATDGDMFSDATFVNLTVVRGRSPPRGLDCQDTQVAQLLAEKILTKAAAMAAPRAEESFTDAFSRNTRAPQFESLPSSILVREDLAPGASVFQVRTQDGDAGFNGCVLYAISQGNQENCFNIDMESGLMTVLEPLDRERTDRYFLNISVCDQGLPPMASWRMLTVVIEDANDNDPQFLQSRYSAVVSEDAAIGLEVLTVGAFDKDVGPNGQLSYTLLTDVPQFGVHRETGGVFVSAGLDREASPTFLLKVEARDQAERGAQRWAVATLSVIIGDVNDCAPVFVPASYSARVPEDFPPGAVVTWVQGQDPDLGLGGQVRYSLVNDFNGTFEVVDVSENLYAPSFSDFAVRGSVKENSRVGTSVAAAVATDRDAGRDGALRYAIAGGSSAFSIDEETAQFLQTPRASPRRFLFTQSSYNASIWRTLLPRTYAKSKVKMGIVLGPPRSLDVRYSSSPETGDATFKAEAFVMGDFCFLRIRTNGSTLNREVQDNYTLTIKASSQGSLQASATVHITVLDTNDLRPLFSPTTYSMVVPESSPLGASVGRVTATDADLGFNGEFYYFFKNRVDLLAVHPTSGVITLTRPLTQVTGRLELEVQVVDRGLKLYGDSGLGSTARLVLTVHRVNRFPPGLTATAVTPPSWTQMDTVYAVLTVEDEDAGLAGQVEWVSIVDGDPLGYFAVHRSPVSNEYVVKASDLLDWARFPGGFNLTFQARDRGAPPKLSNTLCVQLVLKKPQPAAVEFEKGVYKVKLSEIAPPGTLVDQVRLSPVPPLVNYSLTARSHSTYFDINALTGVVLTTQALSTITQETVELEITDGISQLQTMLQVIIEDANNNPPVFSQTFYDVDINESLPVDSVVLVVSATDADRAENGYVVHTISGLQDVPFAIDQDTGEVRITRDLDIETSADTYTFAVRASDWGSPYRREREVNVTFRLLNINDNVPIFEKVSCRGMIPRDFPVGENIITLSAIDIDELGSVSYRILSGNELDYFTLDPDTGALSLRRSLATAPSLKSGIFNLKVAATDGDMFSDAYVCELTVVRGRSPPRGLDCQDTQVAQLLAEKILTKAAAMAAPRAEESFTDAFSRNNGRHSLSPCPAAF